MSVNHSPGTLVRLSLKKLVYRCIYTNGCHNAWSGEKMQNKNILTLLSIPSRLLRCNGSSPPVSCNYTSNGCRWGRKRKTKTEKRGGQSRAHSLLEGKDSPNDTLKFWDVIPLEGELKEDQIDGLSPEPQPQNLADIPDLGVVLFEKADS